MLLSYLYQKLSQSLLRQNEEFNGAHWISWKDGLEKAKEEKKPILVFVQDPKCTGCAAFESEFNSSLKAMELGSKFVLVRIPRDSAPKNFGPDGNYVPRVLFTDSQGNLIHVVNSLGNPRRLYNYVTIKSLLVSMAEALRRHNGDGG